MRDQEILGLYEAYQQVHSSHELTEEVQIAAQYFIEMGLNDEGVDILIEELGVEEFAEFVYDISEEYVLTEARAGGAKIEPKLSSGKPVQGKPKAATLKSLRKQKAARQEAENKASESKPSGLKASLKRQSAVATAAKKQPRKKSALDHVAGAVLRGIDRHNKAMGGLKKMGAATKETAGKVKKAAGEFKKGFTSEETDLFDYMLEYLVAEGYADTNQNALVIMANMSEEWRSSIVEEIGIVGPPKKGIDKIPGVRGLRIAAANAVKASDYPERQDVPMAGKHVIPTERSTPAIAKTRPYTRSEINRGALSGATGRRPVGFKDISGD